MKESKAKSTLLLVAAVLLLTLAPGRAQTTFTWGTTTTPASWADQLNWSTGTLPTTINDTAAFTNVDITADTTVTLDANQNIGSLVFGDTATGTAGSWLINAGSLANATLTLGGTTPTVTVNALGAGKSANINTPVAGSSGMKVNGPGTLWLNLGGGGLWTGGVTIDQATLGLGGAVGTVNQLGGGTVTLTNGGRLQLNGYNSGTQAGNFTNPIVVPAGTTGTLLVPGRGAYTGAVTVNGTLNWNLSYIRSTPSGDWSASTGLINLTGVTSGGAAGGDVYLTGTGNFSFGTAELNFGTGAGSLYTSGNYGSTFTFTIGAVSGSGGRLAGGSATGPTSRTTFFVVGGKNTDATFLGRIDDSPRQAAVTKIGTGAWYLGGINNYSAATLISTGAVYGITGGSISNSIITVATNLAYGGSTFGVKVATAGGSWTGTNLVLRSGTKLAFNFGTVAPSSTTAPLNLLGAITATNAVTLNIAGGTVWAVGTTYPLVKYTGAFVGDGFAAFTLGTLPLRVTGVLVNDTVNKQISFTVTGNNEPLSWATGNGAWDLNTTANWKDAAATVTTYQEQLGLGDPVVFEDALSGSTPIAVTLNTTLSPAGLTVTNNTKEFTISGTGSIGGTVDITKRGSGKLTLATTNTTTGALNLNGGTVNFATLGNLGNGTAINFNGGTLQYAVGNTADISTRTVTVNAGGATIDTAGNSVTFAQRIGNNGTGSLTKTGNGTLTLNTNSTFTGNTIITGGTLALGTGATLANSPAVVVGLGTALDASLPGSGFNLNGALNQVLAGSGTVTGAVTTASGTTITPATNGTVNTLTFNNDLNLNGGSYVFDVGTTTKDMIVVKGTLNLNGGTVVINPLDTLTNGVYKLIQYAGYNYNLSSVLISGSQANKSFALSDANSGQIDLVVATSSTNNLTWVGDGGANYWDILTTTNWFNNSTLALGYFNSGDRVTFNDSGSTTPAVNIAAPVASSIIKVDATSTYTFNGAKITGSGTSLVKTNTGRLILANVGNDFGGTTVIKGGVLQIGDGATGGTALGTGSVTNDAALVFNQPDNSTVAGSISGTGNLTQLSANPAATLTLLGNNSYSGATIVDTATLQVGNGGLSGTLSASSVVMSNAATLVVNRAGTLALNNGISGNGQLTIAGAGTITLGGLNAYTNNTTIANGILKLGANNAIPSGGATTGWLVMDSGTPVAGTLDLNGFNQTVNALAGLNGTVKAQILNNSGAGTSILTVNTANANADTDYYGLIVDNTSGSGKVALVKAGAFALNLRGANNFSGDTTIYPGTLGISSAASVGNGMITLQGGTLSGLAVFDLNGKNLTVPVGTNGVINMSSRMRLPTLYGGGNLGINVNSSGISSPSAPGDSFATCVNFTGSLNITGVVANAQMSFFFNGGSFDGQLQNATLNLDAVSLVGINNSSGNTAQIGGLNGTATSALGGSAYAGTQIYQIGALNTDGIMDGNVSGNGAIVKVGTGKLTLNGANSYTGNTTVNAGTIVVGPSGFMNASPSITVAAGATFDVSAASPVTLGANQSLVGSGVITGSVVAVTSDIINPGGSGTVGTLSFSNHLAQTGGTVTNLLDLSSDPTGLVRTNDLIVVAGDLSFTGVNTIQINSLNGYLGAGTYTLIKYGGILTGDGNPVNPGAITNYLTLGGSITTNAHATLIVSNAPGAIVLTVIPTGANLTWQGGVTGTATNNWDVNISSNWVNSASETTNFLTYDSVTFTNGTTNLTATLAGTLVSGLVLVNSDSNYVFAGTGKVSGPAGITKSGTGMLTITATGGNDYTGTVTIKDGTFKAGVATALGATNGMTIITNTGALDIGGFALANEQITVSGNGSGNGAIFNTGGSQANALQFVTLAGDATFGGTNRWDIRTNAIGAYLQGNGHKLTKISTNDIYLVNVGNANLGNVEIQQGRLGVQDNTQLGAGGTLTLFAGAGLDLYNNGVTNAKPVALTNAAISSTSGTNVFGGTISLNGTGTFTITTPLQLNGALGGSGGVLKLGAGALTLNSPTTYTGNTTISNGAVILTGAASLANSANVDLAVAGAALDVSASGLFTLSSGQTLKGLGTVRGSVTVAAGSAVSPGESGIGTLTVTNVLALSGNTLMDLNTNSVPNCDRLVATNINYGGTLVLNLGSGVAAGNSFQLFSAVSRTGTFTLSPASPGAGLAWDTTQLASSGILSVSATGPSGPALLTNTVSGNTLTLSWPAGQGWVLQVQTNSLLVGLGSNWVDLVPASAGVATTNLTINPARPTVFYRLFYPAP